MHTAPPTVDSSRDTWEYAYLLKTNARMRRRVQAVQRQQKLRTFKAAIELLLEEALEARAVPNE